TVSNEARCFLAHQHERVVASMLRLFPEPFHDHVEGRRRAAPIALIAPIVDIENGRAVLDETQLAKQPDWTYDDVASGKTPVERLASSEP
ncbi:MAG: hypothetical protein ACRDJP_05925, partial [Actinomycetota bacterium]